MPGTHDITPPVLTGLTLDSINLDATAAPATLTATVTAIDDLAGVALIVIVLNSGPSSVSAAATVQPPATSANQTVTVTFPQYSRAGAWTIDELKLRDAAGNTATYNATQLAAMSLPNTVSLA